MKKICKFYRKEGELVEFEVEEGKKGLKYPPGSVTQRDRFFLREEKKK